MKDDGLRRYLYEYLYFRAIEQTKETLGRPIMVSAAKRLRNEIVAKLEVQGMSLDDPRQKVSPVLAVIDETLGENIDGYQPVFGDKTMSSEGYRKFSGEFIKVSGFGQKQVTTGKDSFTNRLPVSPYDPRFSGRSTVRQAGSTLLFATEDDIETMADGSPANLDKVTTPALKFFRASDTSDRLIEAGAAVSLDDMSGMSELMSYMSEKEYRDVHSWVIEGAKVGGTIKPERFMSPEAVERSVAILDALREEGVEYTIAKDRRPGQIKAQLNGTGINIRLTETRDKESYIGRVYDNGAEIYFSTNYRAPGTQKAATYTPTPDECVELVNIARGKAVQRRDGKGVVGVPGVVNGLRPNTTMNASYSSNDMSSMVFGNYGNTNAKVFVRRGTSHRSLTSRFFAGQEDAVEFLDNAVATAQQNLNAAINVENLIEEARNNVEAIESETYVPQFNGDPQVAAIQRAYWDVLTGKADELIIPGDPEVEALDNIGVVGEFGEDETRLIESERVIGKVEEQVRRHANDLVQRMVGSLDPKIWRHPEDPAPVHGRFDPVVVAQYMDSEYGTWRNNDDLVAAMRKAEINPDELRGSSFYNSTVKNRLVQFDSETALPIHQIEDPFVRNMMHVATEAISRNGCVVRHLDIDNNGIIRYEVDRIKGQAAGKETESVVGYIGQIFEPGDNGAITTRFAGSDNYMFVPGYEATVVAQKAGESLTVEERTRLRGYEQIMADQIEYTIASDLMVKRPEVGEPTSVNGVYRRLYDVRHATNFLEQSLEEGLSDDWRDAILETEGRRVRYSNTIKEGSTINADYQAKIGRGNLDPSNDNFHDAWVLTGGRNMSIMTGEGDGYFDPLMTSGSTNQGVTRYLVESAVVNPDGTITPGDKDDQTPLMKHPDAQWMKFNPFDRQQMTSSNLMQAAAVTQPVGTAMMTFGGWNFDDGIIVSEKFAKEHQIRSVNGEMRDLVVGDKLSDLHGNKGVISLVVDPEMSPSEAEAQGLTEAVEWFRNNPEMDVVMSPFSAVSRYNGGSARELMQNTADLRNPDGAVIPGGIGHARFIVTHMAVDAKTRIYDEDDLAAGRGRKASSQLAWALGSQGADKVLAEAYGTNTSATANLRELLITTGLDIEPDGTLRVGWAEHDSTDVRRLIEMPELKHNSNGAVDMATMKREFGQIIGDRGGDLELPFPLTFPTGDEIPTATDNTWALPVLSSHLRSGQDLGDGTSTVHDYTNHYLSVFEQATRYRNAQEKMADPSLSQADRDKLQRSLVEHRSKAQLAFDSITEDIKNRRFAGKHNVFRDQIMANRMPNSATAVWSADPRLEIDQMAMGPAMAASLGVTENDHVLVWRDPMLRDAGVRYMRVAIDERLTGVSINPVMDKSFDGDFDGDAVAVVKLNTKAAKAQAMEKLSVGANLLDKGQIREDGTYPLMVQDALDVKVSQHENPGLTEWFESLTMTANEIDEDLRTGEITAAEAVAQQRRLVGELSTYFGEALDNQYAGAAVRFDGVESHAKSVYESCVETGAKGSEKKWRDYLEYLAVEVDDEGNFTDVYENHINGVAPAPQADGLIVGRENHEAVQYATAVKSFGTGVAGSYSQRGVKALRNVALKPVLELTYPVTQSVLQSKHDPIEARGKYETLMGPARELWRGRKLVEERVLVDGVETRQWAVVRDEKGQPEQADTETWKRQFMEIYSAKDGLNVSINPDNVDEVAQALTDRNGFIADIEAEPTPSSPNKASTMDKMAYGGTFETLVEAAQRRENVFSGEQNANFAPFVVRNNAKSIERFDADIEAGREVGYEPEVTVLTARDTQSAGATRGANKRSEYVTTRKATWSDVAPSVTEYDLEIEEATQSSDFEMDL